MSGTFAGVALAIVSGLVGGTTLMPMKFVRAWKWEHSWATYSLFAYLLAPVLTAVLTVPQILDVYAAAGVRPVALVTLFGFAWGWGVVLYGLALDTVGLSLTSAIILGTSVVVGSLTPLVARHPERIATAPGLQIVGADLLMLAGVLLCARAGGLRERNSRKSAQRDPRFYRGLVLCFVSGVFSALLNLALAFGGSITQEGVSRGASPLNAGNAVWGLTISMGSLPSLGICAVKLARRRTWGDFGRPESARNVTLCAAMGGCFMISTAMYGSATGMLGPLGTVVGWPIYLSTVILGNNFWGWYTGEWKGVRGTPVTLMLAGVLCQILAMGALGGVQ